MQGRTNDIEWEYALAATAYLKEKGLLGDFNKRWVNKGIVLPNGDMTRSAEDVGAQEPCQAATS